MYAYFKTASCLGFENADVNKSVYKSRSRAPEVFVQMFGLHTVFPVRNITMFDGLYICHI